MERRGVDVRLVLGRKRSGSQHQDGQRHDPQEFHDFTPTSIPPDSLEKGGVDGGYCLYRAVSGRGFRH
jgi:hypothetical protein